MARAAKPGSGPAIADDNSIDKFPESFDEGLKQRTSMNGSG